MKADKNKSGREAHIDNVSAVRGDNHWVSGHFGDHMYVAKVYDTSSDFGINGSRVSKLIVWRAKESAGSTQKKEVVRYKRGWNFPPETDDDNLAFSAILSWLETMPPKTPNKES